MKLTSLSFDPLSADNVKLHRFFRFPGSFHPPLIKHLIELHPECRSLADPMAGSGTLAIQGVIEGKEVFSMDIDPLSCLVTKVKSNPISRERLRELMKEWTSSVDRIPLPTESSIKRCLPVLDELTQTTHYLIPDKVYHWFDPYVVEILAKLLLALKTINTSPYEREILESIFASILRRVSRADLQPVSGLEVTKVMRKRLENGLAFNPIMELCKKGAQLIDGFRHYESLENMGTSSVKLGDVKKDWELASKKHSKFDLVITLSLIHI